MSSLLSLVRTSWESGIETSVKHRAAMTPAELKQDDERIDAFFSLIGDIFFLVRIICTFGLIFWLGREISYQRYAYNRSRYWREINEI